MLLLNAMLVCCVISIIKLFWLANEFSSGRMTAKASRKHDEIKGMFSKKGVVEREEPSAPRSADGGCLHNSRMVKLC